MPLAQALHGEAVAEQQVVRHAQRLRAQLTAGRVHPGPVASSEERQGSFSVVQWRMTSLSASTA